jgi:hypothetical protein
MTTVRILLATPAHDGHVCTSYHKAVLDTLLFFKAEFPGIRFESKIISMSLLPRARDIFASIVLNDPSFTHLLFIDSDMGFWPELIANMLASGKPVTGVIAPRKSMDFREFHRASIEHDTPMLARVLAADYIGGGNDLVVTTEADGGRVCEIENGFVRTKTAGTGIMLIAREVFELIRERFPELWVADPKMESAGLNGGLLQCFDPMNIRDPDGIIVGEDVAFCRRWVDGCGGEIWANVDQPIIHAGQELFVGKYLHKLLREKRLRVRMSDASNGTVGERDGGLPLHAAASSTAYPYARVR